MATVGSSGGGGGAGERGHDGYIPWDSDSGRGGAKGVLFYLLNDSCHYTEESIAPDSPDRKRMQRSLDEYGVVAKHGSNVLVKVKKEIDPGNALTKPGGDPTPQFAAIGGAFGAIAPHKRRLLASRRALFPVFFPEGDNVRAPTPRRARSRFPGLRTPRAQTTRYA